MAFEKNNKLWMLRETHGRDQEYKTVEELAAKIVEYVEWNDANPWYKQEQLKKPVFTGTDEKGHKIFQTVANIPTARPLSIGGLCDYLGIHTTTWADYGKKPDFSSIVGRTNQFIKTQQFEGATVGAFNASIISKTLGLVDKTETGYRDKDGNPIDPPGPVKQVIIIGGKEIEF